MTAVALALHIFGAVVCLCPSWPLSPSFLSRLSLSEVADLKATETLGQSVRYSI
jgi:hypothetical protein